MRVNQNFMPASEHSASSLTVNADRKRENGLFFLHVCRHHLLILFRPGSSARTASRCAVPRLAQNNIIHFLERTVLFIVWFFLCAVIISRYSALPAFFIQTKLDKQLSNQRRFLTSNGFRTRPIASHQSQYDKS